MFVLAVHFSNEQAGGAEPVGGEGRRLHTVVYLGRHNEWVDDLSTVPEVHRATVRLCQECL